MAETEIRSRLSSHVRAVAEDKLLVLGLPFNGPSNRDRLGEFVTRATEIMMGSGDVRPVVMHHGFTTEGQPVGRPEVVGDARLVKTDDRGHWFEVTLRGASEFVADLIGKAKEGLLKASTGAISHLTRTRQDGHVDIWPIGELSLVDVAAGQQPVSDLAVAVPLRSWFDAAGLEYPESLAESEQEKASEAVEDEGGNTDETGDEEQWIRTRTRVTLPKSSLPRMRLRKLRLKLPGKRSRR